MRRRAFIPAIDGGKLEPRILLDGDSVARGWIFGNPLPQSYIALKDSNGVSYTVNNGQELYNGLLKIRAGGAYIADLKIKGHGGGDVMVLSDADPVNDTLAAFRTGQISLAGHDVTSLMQQVTNSHTIIRLEGCETRDMAQQMSAILRRDAIVYGSPTYAIGIPWSETTYGIYSVYVNGEFDRPPPSPPVYK